MTTNPLHSNKSAEWYTPSYIIDAARTVLGSIDLDPCSCAEANDVVKAKYIYGKEEDGLVQSWFGNVFVNPPSKCGECEKRCTCKLPRRFMERTVNQYYDGAVNAAIYLGFNLGQLKYLEDMEFHSDDIRFVIPRKRIKFWKPNEKKNNPTQDNFIMLLCNDIATRTKFDEIFGVLGQVYQTV